MQEILDAPEWFQALTLAERAVLIPVDSPPDGSDLPTAEQLERAARKVRRWREEADLRDDALFAERLAQDGLTPERFLRILAEPASGLRRRAGGRPAWLDSLDRAFFRTLSPPQEGSEPAEGLAELGVLELFRPLLREARALLLAGLRELGGEGIDAESVAASLLPTLVRRLRWASERILALELQVSRLEGRLRGDTPEERFASFVEDLGRPAVALEILRRYPVLARDACRHCDQWVETSLEMARRYAADRPEIVRLLLDGEKPGADPGLLTIVEFGRSDRHLGGRSVAILTLSSGLRIVYKPKPLAIDRQFQELIAWLDERGAEPPLRRVAVLDRGAYGWMEHVTALPCETLGEVERFHERQGAWVALLYVLEATDFHHENLIAEGEHPVPIDLETLFQPARAQPGVRGPGYLPTANTVLNSGLLPRRFWATANEEGLDLSGMGALGGQKVGIRQIAGDGTDRMRWDLTEAELAAGPNLPTLRGEPVALQEHGEAVQRGFRALYRLLERHRGELLAPSGPLRPFRGLPTRTLLRGTGIYAYLLQLGNHPDYAQDALDRERLYDRLWLDAAGYPPLRGAVGMEREDLLAGDVPCWRVRSDSTDLLHPGAAGRAVPGYFAFSGLDQVAARLRGLSEDDLERQSWLARGSIEATRPLGPVREGGVEPLPESGPASADRFLRTARDLGDRLAQLAIEDGEALTWFHLNLRPGGWQLEPMSVDLYSGLAGLALFFAHLGRLSGEARYEDLARRALGMAVWRIEDAPESLEYVGAFSGWGGLVYAFTHLGLLWGEPEWLAAAERLAVERMTGIETDREHDLIAGNAGALAALLTLHRHRPSPATLTVALRCGERLLACAVPHPDAGSGQEGWGWPPPEGEGQPLTGFSHGAAGVAWALARLAEASGEERFRDAARRALRYERSHFDPAQGNWPDLRPGPAAGQPPRYLLAWCHGAPGIGLGRIGTRPFLDDPEMLEEIRAAARATLAGGFGGSQCLCHGDLGNLDFLRQAARVLEDDSLSAEADRLAAGILARIEKGELRWGADPRIEALGLMVGLAGIGYGLLRAAFPDRVPSVLLLETPPQNKSRVSTIAPQ